MALILRQKNVHFGSHAHTIYSKPSGMFLYAVAFPGGGRNFLKPPAGEGAEGAAPKTPVAVFDGQKPIHVTI